MGASHTLPISYDSNPISVRRKHQQLPSSLLIENASTWFLGLKAAVLSVEAFPIKANDYTTN